MKKNYFLLLLFVAAFFSASSASAQSFKELDKNPHDIVYFRENKISPPKIKVLYGRPQKEESREVFGDLIPYGKIWQAGADEATEIRFYQDVVFGGTKVKKGVYVLYAIPGQKEWTIILNSNIDVWGTEGYKNKYDVARIRVKVRKAESIDIFSIGFKEKSKKVDMILGWDTTRAIIPIVI